MGLFQAFDISASGMTAQRFRTDIISENVANVNTTRTVDGTPYRRKVVTFQEKDVTPFTNVLQGTRQQYAGNGVKVVSVTEDNETDYIMKYDPSHPDADANGYVSYPNVNIVTEMTNLIVHMKQMQLHLMQARRSHRQDYRLASRNDTGG